MIESSTRTKLAALTLAVLMVGGAFVMPAMAAVPGIDTETGNTATTSDISAGTTVANFDASSDKYLTVAVTADTNDSKVEILRKDTGQVVYSNASMFEAAVDTSTTPDTYYMEANLSHAEMKELERDANENVTMQLKVTNDTTASSPDTKTVDFYIENSKNKTVAFISDADKSATDSPVEINTRGRDYILFDTRTDYSETTTIESVDSAENTTVTYVFGNTTTADTFSAAEDSMGSLSSGDTFWFVTTETEDKLVRPFFKSAASDHPDTYAVYKSNFEGHPAVTYHYNASGRFDDLNGRAEIENTVKGNKKPSLGMDVFDAFGVGGLWDVATAGGLT